MSSTNNDTNAPPPADASRPPPVDVPPPHHFPFATVPYSFSHAVHPTVTPHSSTSPFVIGAPPVFDRFTHGLDTAVQLVQQSLHNVPAPPVSAPSPVVVHPPMPPSTPGMVHHIGHSPTQTAPHHASPPYAHAAPHHASPPYALHPYTHPLFGLHPYPPGDASFTAGPTSMVAGMIPYHGFYPLPYGGYPSSTVHASPTTTTPSPVIDDAPVSDPHSASTPSDNPADPSPAAPPGNPAPSPADLPAPASTTIHPTSPTLNAAPVVPDTVEVPSIEPPVPGPAAAPAAVPPRHSPTGAPPPVAAFLPSRHAPSLPVSPPGVPPYQPFHYSPMPHPTPPTPASHASPLFPNAGQYRAVPLSPAEFARSNVLLSKFDRGSPGSREYKSNSDTICTAPNAKFRLSYVDTDTVADPTKFNIQLASTALSRQACLTHISNHIMSYDLGDSLLVPDRINYASAPHAPSGDRHDVLFHHTRFTFEYVQEWQFWCNGHHKTEDAASDRLLVVYFFKCLDGALLTEVTEDYYEIEADFRGAAVLVFLTMTKLQTNSFHCIQAYQGILMHFNISAVPEEKVSLASSWLKAVTKALQLSNDIPNTALSSILRGMQRSKHRSFNMFAAILASQHTRFTPRPGVDSSKAHMKQIFDTLDQLTQEYRMYKESGHWPMANAGKQSSALVTAPTPSGSSSTTSATKSKSANPRESLCYNPDCLSPDHVIADCPVPLPPGYDRSRGRSRERASKPRGSSRSQSRGHSRGSSRGASRERRPSATRAPTPAPKKSSSEKSSVAFANNVSVASTTADDASACSTTSSYDDSALQAFILRGPPKE